MMFGLGGMWLWLLIVVVVVFVVVWGTRGGKSSSGEPTSPESVLKRRYARGEIDREEYRRRLEDLRQ